MSGVVRGLLQSAEGLFNTVGVGGLWFQGGYSNLTSSAAQIFNVLLRPYRALGVIFACVHRALPYAGGWRPYRA